MRYTKQKILLYEKTLMRYGYILSNADLRGCCIDIKKLKLCINNSNVVVDISLNYKNSFVQDWR